MNARESVRGHARRAVAATLALTVATIPHAAFAQNAAQLQAQANEMVDKIEQTTQTYQAAVAEVERIDAQIAENEERSEDIQSRLPEQRNRTAASVKNMYMFQQSSPDLLSIILTAQDFNEFLTTLRYFDAIYQRNATEINALVSLENEYNATQAELVTQRDNASQKESEALQALDEARATRKELQDRANAVAAAESASRSQALTVAQNAVAKAAEASAALPQEEQKPVEVTNPPADDTPVTEAAPTFTTSSGTTAVVEVAPEPDASTEPLVENTTSPEVDSWAARIDAYLAGSPLEGYGADFAQAASDYGVDPRISPAISCVESGKGAVCFRPHNAWGWGQVSWPDWPSAIRGHVSGFARGYGGTLTLEGAQMYAGSSIYPEWYSTVLSEMGRI